MITIGDIINGREPIIEEIICLRDCFDGDEYFESYEEALNYIKEHYRIYDGEAEDYDDFSEIRQFNEALRTEICLDDAINLVNYEDGIGLLELYLKNNIEEIARYQSYFDPDYEFMLDLLIGLSPDINKAPDVNKVVEKLGEIIKEDPCFLRSEWENENIDLYFNGLIRYILADDNRTLLCYEYADKQLTDEMREKYPEVAEFIEDSIEQLSEDLNRNTKEIEGSSRVR